MDVVGGSAVPRTGPVHAVPGTALRGYSMPVAAVHRAVPSTCTRHVCITHGNGIHAAVATSWRRQVNRHSALLGAASGAGPANLCSAAAAGAGAGTDDGRRTVRAVTQTPTCCRWSATATATATAITTAAAAATATATATAAATAAAAATATATGCGVTVLLVLPHHSTAAAGRVAGSTAHRTTAARGRYRGVHLAVTVPAAFVTDCWSRRRLGARCAGTGRPSRARAVQQRYQVLRLLP